TSALATLPTTRSGNPSRLRSAIATGFGLVPAKNGVGAPKPPTPSPSRTDTVVPGELVTTISRTPSPLRSADAMASPPGANAAAAPNPPAPSPSRTEVAPLEVATPRSAIPSKLKSPVVNPRGPAPIAYAAGTPNAIAGRGLNVAVQARSAVMVTTP